MNAALIFVCIINFFVGSNAASCSIGFFGKNCAKQCHCLASSCLNEVDSLGCETGTCSPGYTGFPDCQNKCPSSRFGVGCGQVCSCAPTNNCSHINGNCIAPNKCTYDKTGPGCQIAKSKLSRAPLLGINCSNLSVTWRAFDKTVDFGVPDVREYKIEIMFSSSSKTFKLLSAVDGPPTEPDGKTFYKTFSNLPSGESFSIRIVPVFFLDMGVGDGYSEDGLASPASRRITIPREVCSETYPTIHPPLINTSLPPITTTIVPIPSTTPAIVSISRTTPVIVPIPTTTRAPEPLTGPRNCKLIGLGKTWAVFTWNAGLPTCSHGSLLGYEMAARSMGTGEDVVKRYRSDALTTTLLAIELLPGTQYEVQIFAIFERGSVACSDTLNKVLTTFPAESTSPLRMSVLERRHDRFTVQVFFESPVGPTELWVSAFVLDSGLPSSTNDLPFASSENVRSGQHHLSFTVSIHPATKYRLYGWSPSVSKASFEGTTLDLWTAPKPFMTSPNFAIGDPILVEPRDYTASFLFPNVTGYTGGPITDYFMAISPGDVEIPLNSQDVDSSDLRRRLALPPNATIAFHSRTHSSSSSPQSRVIVLGDGIVQSEWRRTSPPGLFADSRLTPETNYTLFVVVVSAVGGVEETEDVFAVSPTRRLVFRTREELPVLAGSSRGVTVGVTIAVLLFALIGVSIVVWCLRRYSDIWRKSKQYSLNLRPKRQPSDRNTLPPPSFEDCMEVLPRSYSSWSFPVNLRDPRFLVIDPERGPDNTLLGTKGLQEIAHTFLREYKSLPVNKALPQAHANKAANRGKNRSQDVLPYDHNRVHLTRAPNSSKNDYINASFLDSYMRRKAYIAAQSPFNASTASDFWSMIAQCNISQIVFLTNQIEDGAVRCTKYWPETDADSVYMDKPSAAGERQYDSIFVLALGVVEYAHFSVRKFKVSDVASGTTHFVTQYHYHSWFHKSSASSGNYGSDGRTTTENQSPRFSCSDIIGFDHMAFIDFYFHVKMTTRMEDGPILVHCEEGVSRTSIFIAFDVLFQQFMHEHSVTVARTCANLRRARQHMVPTMRHYALLYDILFEAGIAGHSLVDLDVRSALKSLKQPNSVTGFTYLTEQWYLLHNYAPRPDRKTSILEALNPANAPKNRYPSSLDFLPPDYCRPRVPLHYTAAGSCTDYVNAVFVDGLAVKEDVILTQTPMDNTVEDFWRLVFEERVTCIVDMEPLGYGTDNAPRYWPAVSEDYLLSPELDIPDCLTTFPFEVAEDTGSVVDSDGDVAVPRDVDTWYQLEEFQLAQAGKLRPIKRPDDGRKCVVFKRRMVIRRLSVEDARGGGGILRCSEIRSVVIYHFTGSWKPASQVPSSRAHFLHLLEEVTTERGLGPMLVHCLDGATRSGLFVASFVLTERITRDHFIDLFHSLKTLKLRRRAVVNSVTQLRFIYRILADWVDLAVNKPLAVQRQSFPISFVEDSFLGTLRSGEKQDLSTSAVFSSRTSIDTAAGGTSMCDGNANNSVVAGSATQERQVVVLYRYFSEELSRLVRGCTILNNLERPPRA